MATVLPLASLSLDQPVDLERIGATYGALSLELNDRVDTYPKLATLLRDVKAESIAAGVPFHTVNVRFRILRDNNLAEDITTEMIEAENLATQIKQLADRRLNDKRFTPYGMNLLLRLERVFFWPKRQTDTFDVMV